MELYVLDENFNLIANGIPYDNLQWNRKYYEAGNFSVRLPVQFYDPSWKYIGTFDRPELGMIQKKEVQGEGDVTILLSGFFCEKMLDDKVIYPEFRWVPSDLFPQSQSLDVMINQLFTSYKKDLPINIIQQSNTGIKDKVEIITVDNQLGEKIYSILETFECSYSVSYDYVSNRLMFYIWRGKDRTQSQNVNAYQTFSTEFGNITGKKIDIDESGFKNYAIIPVMDDGETVGADTYYLDWSNGGYKKEIVFDMRSRWPDEYTTDAEFKNIVLQEAAEMLSTYAIVEDINIEIANNHGYRYDYDLGDKCDVILSDIGVAMETRIVEVNEVFKAEDGHTVTIGLGNKRIDNIRRAVRK